MQGPQAYLAKFFLERAKMAWPHRSGVLKKTPECNRIRGQKCGETLGTFARVAAPARRDKVATGPVAASYLRLHVVHRQLGNVKDITAVDTPVVVTRKHILALHSADPDIQLIKYDRQGRKQTQRQCQVND